MNSNTVNRQTPNTVATKWVGDRLPSGIVKLGKSVRSGTINGAGGEKLTTGRVNCERTPQSHIRTVWKSNLFKEIDAMAVLVNKYNYIAVDSEFPGVVVRPVDRVNTPYQKLRRNTDLIKVIQLGLTLFDANGNTPQGICTWLFNFHFDVNKDMFAQESIDELVVSGIDFEKHRRQGADPFVFAEYLIGSGLVMMDHVTWVSFYGIYDYSFLLKLLTTIDLPKTEAEFSEILVLHFPRFFDLQCVLRDQAEKNNQDGNDNQDECKQCDKTDSRFQLNSVAEKFNVKRASGDFQAAADSILTMKVYLKLLDLTSLANIEEHCRCVQGLELKGNNENLIPFNVPEHLEEVQPEYPHMVPTETVSSLPSQAIPILPPRHG